MLVRATALPLCYLFFFFNDTATTEIYTLSLHDALPICQRPTVTVPAPPKTQARKRPSLDMPVPMAGSTASGARVRRPQADRKSTRLNSSHDQISYAVFCLKKKKNKPREEPPQNTPSEDA